MSGQDRSQQVRGSLKEALGKITGDPAIEAEGRAEKRPRRTASAPPVKSSGAGKSRPKS